MRRTVAEIQKMTVEDAKAHLAKLKPAELAELRRLEVAEGDGKTRVTLLAAIDGLAPEGGQAGAPAEGVAAGGEIVAPDAPVSAAPGGPVVEGEGDPDLDRNDDGVADAVDDRATGADPTAEINLGADPALPGPGAGDVSAPEAAPGAAEADATAEPEGDGKDDLAAALAAEREAIDAEAAAAAEADARAQHDAKAEAERALADAAEARELFLDATAKDAKRDVSAAVEAGARLFFAEGASFVPLPAIQLDPQDLEDRGGRIVLLRAIDFAPGQAPARVDAAWLRVGDAWAVCPISGGLATGGGHEAQLPAGHLAFARGA